MGSNPPRRERKNTRQGVFSFALFSGGFERLRVRKQSGGLFSRNRDQATVQLSRSEKVELAGARPNPPRREKKKSRERLFLFVLFTLLSSLFSLLSVLLPRLLPVKREERKEKRKGGFSLREKQLISYSHIGDIRVQ